MWYAPRATARRLVDSRAPGALPLSMLLGISQALDRAATRDLGATMSLPAILALGVAVGAVLGPLTLFLGAWLVRWTGSWLGGRGTAAELRTALAWGQVPTVSAMPLWIPILLVGGVELFRAEPRFASPADGFVILVCGLAMGAAGIWGTVTSVLCVAEAHRFSGWKALASVALGLLVLAVPIGLVGLAMALLARAGP
jgi:hypothetical protein